MKKIAITLLLMLMLTIITTNTYAEDIVNQIGRPHIDTELAGSINGIVGVVQIVGSMAAVLASIYLGIRYVLSATDEKAEIKKKLIPFVIGVIIFYGATGILQLIAEVAGWF